MHQRLNECRLYGIVDLGYVTASIAPEVLAAMVEGGVDIIQLRAKQLNVEEIVQLARELQVVAAASNVPLIINDHPEIARDVRAAGVHLGQDDVSISVARSIVGPRCLIGRSTHSLKQARTAAAEGADYIGFGPLFATPTKPDYTPIGLSEIKEAHETITLPIFCIGGIKLDNLAQVVAAGARRVVIVSGLLQASDVVSATRAAKELLTRNQKSEIRNQK